MTSAAWGSATGDGRSGEQVIAGAAASENTTLSLVRPGAAGRIELGRVATGVRHLLGSAEPARVFSQLASICVPGVADSCVIELSERGGHRYRIRQPADDRPAGGTVTVSVPGDGSRPVHAVATVSPRTVTVQFASPDEGCQSYIGLLSCRWKDGYQPCEADAALLALLVDHATALVERERLSVRVADLQDAAGHEITLPTHQRIAAAVGILMSLHHLSAAQAADLLTRASQHTRQTITGVADTVLRTGSMPEHAHHPTVAESRRTDTAPQPLRTSSD